MYKKSLIVEVFVYFLVFWTKIRHEEITNEEMSLSVYM